MVFVKIMASNKWAGFTDEDIEIMKLNSSFLSDNNQTNSNSPKLLSSVKNVCTKQPSERLTDDSYTSVSQEKLQQLRDSWKLKEASKSLSNDYLDSCTCNHNDNEFSLESHEASGMASNYKEVSENPSISSTTDCQDLQAFEMRKKLVEAENARRRALINKAIMDKKERTQAEAKKLTQIAEELNRLDSILSSDIVILRDYIEKASREFSQAEKRYLKAEKEFIEAKFDLFEKMQRKEQLTEHLCAIIEQNENRKASKLVDLMKQLEMDTVIGDFEVPEMKPILSKYCIMNDEAYHCCQTLKPSTRSSVAELQNNRADQTLDEGSNAEEEQAA